MSHRKTRLFVLQQISLQALQLASFMSDERYLGSFRTTMKVMTKPDVFVTVRGHRLQRLRRPLFLGTDGVIYIKIRCAGAVWWEKAQLRQRDLEGLDRINKALGKEIARILKKSPGSMQYSPAGR